MNTNWCKTIQILNSSFNLHSRDITPKDFPTKMKNKIISDFTIHWKARISNPAVEKKLGLYSKIKNKFAIEPYMNLPFRDRQIISKIVGSSHKLEVEIGRHRDIPREERLCKLCDLNKVEDEEHFISECPAYTHIRKDFFRQATLTKKTAKHMLLEIEPATMADFLRTIYNTRGKLVEEKPPVFHSVKTGTMSYTFIKGPKRNLSVRNVTKDGLKITIVKGK